MRTPGLGLGLVFWMGAAALVQAQETVVAALSQNRVAITANFDGSEIFLFGAVRREAPIDPESSPLEVVIMVAGPSRPVTVRRKERRFGIWVNVDAVRVDQAPSFFAIATTGPLTEIVSETERLRYRIGLDQLVRSIGASEQAEDSPAFLEAVIRVRGLQGLYSEQEGIVDLQADTLFATSIALPANLVEGDYRVTIYLTRDRQVISTTEDMIMVRKEGLERLIYTTAHEMPLLYGILSILVALGAGWSASAAFRLLRP